MPQEKVKKIHLIYGCITAVLIIAVGVSLILSCLDIYHSGSHPYSAVSIAEHFDRIAVLVYITVAVIAGGIILSLALPLEKQRPKAVRDELQDMKKLKEKAGLLSNANCAAVKKEIHQRRIFKSVTVFFMILHALIPVIYFCDVSHFTIANLNGDIVKAAVLVIYAAEVSLLLGYICTLLDLESIRRETEVYKKAISANKAQPAPGASPAAAGKQSKKAWLLSVRCAIVMVAVCFITLGILNGGGDDVLAKAIAICTECIGLG